MTSPTHTVNAPIAAAVGKRRVWLRVGTLLDGLGTQPIRDAHIVYDEKQILFVRGGESPQPELLNPGQRRPDADLPGYTLLPGLIEAHAHLFLEGSELSLDKRAAHLKKTPEELLKAVTARLERLVRLGIIAVRDAGDRHGVGLAISKLYKRGNCPLMPYLDSPGAAIHRKGRYGSFMADALENHPSLRASVESRVKAGADRIKLIATGIIDFQKGAVITEPQMTMEEIRELVATAKQLGKQSFAHASGDAGIERVIDGGVDSVEHGFFVRGDQLGKMRDRNIAWVPTFAPVQDQIDHAELMSWNTEVVSRIQQILEQHAASLVKAHAMGVQVLAGSDAGSCGVPHGLGFLYELELMERAGLSALAVINSATGVSATRLGFKERFGQIKPGYLSRFILTRHSPLNGISNLRKEKYVVFDGAVFHAADGAGYSGL